MANNGRIRLSDPDQMNRFLRALMHCQAYKDELDDYNKDLVRKLGDAWDMFGIDMFLTVKQYNHLVMLASDLK